MLKIVVPMGGEGKPFIDRGFTFPKPLIEIRGRSMIEIVVQNLTPRQPHQFIFICRHEHLTQVALGDVLKLLAPGCKVIPIKQPTHGALCSVLLATEDLSHDDPMLIANADQFIDLPIDDFLNAADQPSVDGCIVTFPSTHPKWSYARIEDGEVVAVAEKRPISKNATAGIYWFRSSCGFLAASERMIMKNAALGNEFYVAPIYNELILGGKRITVFPIPRDRMYSLGTPEELELFATTVGPRLPAIQ